jgi:hypothetical protein
MPSTYTTNNGIELIGTGEQSGTWGETTNTNFGLIDTALDGQLTKTLASAGTSGSPNTLIIEDGTTSDGRNRLVIFNDGSDLGGTAYVQLTPDNAEKIMFVRNSLSGERSIIFFQGTYNASNDFELPNGTDAVIKFNGAGTGAVVEAVFKKLYLQDLLLDTSSAQTMYIESTVPTFNMKETDADLNEKFWRLQTSAGVFKVDAVNDAYDTAATAYSVDRSGVTPNLHIWYSNASEAMRVTSAGNVGIGTSTPATALDVNGTITGTTGNITTVNATTVDTTNIEVTNIKAKDGTASATIANSTGVMTVASSVLTTTDINGGTIDGVTIGGASAGAGTFTSVTGTGLNINGAAVFNESGADVDFRIESNTNVNAFFLQGSDGYVGMGIVPIAALHISSGISDVLRLERKSINGTSFVIVNSRRTTANSFIGGITGEWDGTDVAEVSFITGSDLTNKDDGILVLRTASAGTLEERVRIDQNGNVGIKEANPSQALDVVGNIEVSGGIYLGGTAAANLLDDYEEGTWTPAFTPQTGALGSITYSIQAGNYTKVGRQVTVTGRFQTTGSVTIGTASSGMRISGLPFTVGNGEAFYSAATLTYIESWTTGDAPSSAYVATNSNLMVLRIRNAGSDGPENNMTASEFVAGADGGCSLMFSATYFTA